ncbi:hypothetical protein JYU14_05210, partial [Simkania negevensis]|nr:hypothetical protein [Simkania negevensis]
MALNLRVDNINKQLQGVPMALTNIHNACVSALNFYKKNLDILTGNNQGNKPSTADRVFALCKLIFPGLFGIIPLLCLAGRKITEALSPNLIPPAATAATIAAQVLNPQQPPTKQKEEKEVLPKIKEHLRGIQGLSQQDADKIHGMIEGYYNVHHNNPTTFQHKVNQHLQCAVNKQLRNGITISSDDKNAIMAYLAKLGLFPPISGSSAPSLPSAEPTLGPGYAKEVATIDELKGHKDHIPSVDLVQTTVTNIITSGGNSVRFYMPGEGDPDALVFGFCGNFLEDLIPLTPSLAGETGVARAKTGEAVFQSGKVNEIRTRRTILETSTGKEAFDIEKPSRQLLRQQGWFRKHLSHMREVIAAKFAPGTRLAKLLVTTEGLQLVED